MSTDLVTTTSDVKLIARAVQVQDELLKIKDAVQSNAVDMAFLLREAHQFEYFRVLGANSFESWVESSIELDMSPRQAFYLVGIAKKAEQLGLTKEDLKQTKISKLKQIFSLDPAEFPEEMKQLLASSSSESLEEVAKKVAEFKADTGEEPTSYVKFKLPESVKETLMESFEVCRRMYGSTINEYGEVADISDSRCLELIAVSFIQDAHNQSGPHSPPQKAVYEAEYEVVTQ